MLHWLIFFPPKSRFFFSPLAVYLGVTRSETYTRKSNGQKGASTTRIYQQNGEKSRAEDATCYVQGRGTVYPLLGLPIEQVLVGTDLLC